VEDRRLRKVRQGVVVSDKMDKTIVVATEEMVPHKLYGRIVKQTKKYKAHAENNEARVGDTVRIMETRPISKEKCWRLMEIVKKAE